MVKQSVLFFFSFLLALHLSLLFRSASPAVVSSPPCYLFSYFKNNGEDGLHLAYSHDGLEWTALNRDKPFLAPKVGKEVLMRDPCLMIGSDGRFHMVWTTDWREKGIGLAHSADLIHWTEQEHLPVMRYEPETRNCWAPELFFDERKEQYLIFWSSTIPGKFPKTETAGDDQYNHRIYCTITKDFKTYSTTQLLYDPGFNAIDATIVKVDDKQYAMFLKNETRHPAEKNIYIAFADTPEGPWGPASEPITGDYWAEGPTAIKIGDYWYVYFDKYVEHKYGAVRSKDFKQWEDISDTVKFPEGIRHGTVLEVDCEVLERLKKMP